jgi:hypothetical protein
MTIHDTFTEQTDLARTYAQDGAFRSAARVLRDLATKLIEHADWCDGDVTVALPNKPQEQFGPKMDDAARQALRMVTADQDVTIRFDYGDAEIECTARTFYRHGVLHKRVQWKLHNQRIAPDDLRATFPPVPTLR